MNFNFFKQKNSKGFGLIEAIIGITIAALLLTAFSELMVQTLKINRANAMNIQANMYLQEEIEAAKDLAQSATTTIFAAASPCTNCHVVANGTVWQLSAGPQTIDGFTRSMTISPVSRNSTTHEIESVYDFMDNDPNTKMATATISWYDGSQNHKASLETYLYYYGQ